GLRPRTLGATGGRPRVVVGTRWRLQTGIRRGRRSYGLAYGWRSYGLAQGLAYEPLTMTSKVYRNRKVRSCSPSPRVLEYEDAMCRRFIRCLASPPFPRGSEGSLTR